MILDVVYNHIGPGSEVIAAYGPYFTDRHDTFWGHAIDYSQPGVREWAIQNAEQWVRDYRIDGLRLDAVHAIFDESPQHVLAELAERVRAISPSVLVIVRDGARRPASRSSDWGHDAQWADELHHALHVLLTGERDGYYAAYGGRRPCRGLRGTPRRAAGDLRAEPRPGRQPRVRRPAGRRTSVALRAAVTLFAPQTPLLFMGEEYGETAPFQFFTDHDDPAIAEATREGRRKEFAGFAAFAGEDVPDPQARGDVRALEARPSPAPTTPAARVLPRADRAAPHAPAARSRPTSTERRGLRARRGERRARRGLRRPEDRARSGADGASGRGSRSRSARCGTARARTSRSSRRTPSASSCASSTTTTARRAIEMTRADRLQLALLPPRRRPGHSGTATASTARTSPSRQALQPDEAPDRPVREGDRGADRLRRREHVAVRPRRRATPTSPSTTRTTPDAIPKCVVVDESFDWEDDVGRAGRGTRSAPTPTPVSPWKYPAAAASDRPPVAVQKRSPRTSPSASESLPRTPESSSPPDCPDSPDALVRQHQRQRPSTRSLT